MRAVRMNIRKQNHNMFRFSYESLRGVLICITAILTELNTMKRDSYTLFLHRVANVKLVKTFSRAWQNFEKFN